LKIIAYFFAFNPEVYGYCNKNKTLQEVNFLRRFVKNTLKFNKLLSKIPPNTTPFGKITFIYVSLDISFFFLSSLQNKPASFVVLN